MASTGVATIFNFPERISSDFEGYEFFCHISIKTFNFHGQNIKFNFSKTKWFEVNLCAPLATLIENLKQRKNKITFIGIEERVKNVFKENGFYKLIDSSYRQDDKTVVREELIEFKKFRLEETFEFQTYVNQQLLQYKDFPKASDLLKKKINRSILEIFNNAHIHGACDFVYTCGEYLPTSGMLKFTIADLGITIRKNVNLYFNSGNKIDGKESIEWAVEEGNTTKKGSIPGGLGLSLIRDFLKLNFGTIQIISSNGFWEEKGGVVFGNTFKGRFLGTIVTLDFNLSDDKSYVLTSEINSQNVL